MGRCFGPQNVLLEVRSGVLGMRTEPSAKGAWSLGGIHKHPCSSPSLARDEMFGSGLGKQLHLAGGQQRGHTLVTLVPKQRHSTLISPPRIPLHPAVLAPSTDLLRPPPSKAMPG